MSDAEPNRVDSLSWDAVARRLEAGAAAILPVGAGAKEHGLHLPMGTDRIQAEWLAERIAEHIDAIVWPTLTYGHYPAFAAYPASASLERETFKAVIRDLCSALLGYGSGAVLVLDMGISTAAPIDEVLAAMEHAGRLHHVAVYDGPRFREASAAARQAYGSHADEVETSIMLALAPECVALDRGRASPAALEAAAGPLAPFPSSPNFSASGSYGDPTLATRAFGEKLVAAMLADVLERAEAAIQSPR